MIGIVIPPFATARHPGVQTANPAQLRAETKYTEATPAAMYLGLTKGRLLEDKTPLEEL